MSGGDPLAAEFAARWYARDDAGRDQETLAYLLTEVVRQARRQGAAAERARVRKHLLATLHLEERP